MQLINSVFSDKEVKDQIGKILKRNDVIKFFENSQNI
jgi:hypothetical protein